MHKGRSILVIVCLIAIISGCAHQRPLTVRENIDRSLSDTRYFLGLCRYEKAIDTLSNAMSRYPGNTALNDEYIATMEQVRKAAEKMMEKQDYGNAGELFAKMLKDLKRHSRGSMALSFDEFYLEKRIALCSVKLTEKGLVRYREGEIEVAIALWEDVLAFDPDNREVRNAIKTATLQMRNLEKME